MKLDELQRLAEPGTKMLVAAETMQKLIAVALEGLALVDDFDCHAEPKQSHPRYIERLRTALEELK